MIFFKVIRLLREVKLFVTISKTEQHTFVHVDMMLCIWHPFECDMGLDGTLTSHIELVADEFDMACQSAI